MVGQPKRPERHAQVCRKKPAPGHNLSKRRIPVGAELTPDGVHFRVWAPASKKAAVQLILCAGAAKDGRARAGSGRIFSRIRCPKRALECFTNFNSIPALFPIRHRAISRKVRMGPRKSIDPKTCFAGRTERLARHRRFEGQVVYGMHIGTFTAKGTWTSAMEQLPELARLGVTVLEVMPVADFPGLFGWGYDGVDLFAPTRLYGTPDEFRAFVDRAHALGLGVILDVVYNHIGPDGNYLKQFSPDYFSSRYKNEWGEALNFDGANSAPVREFFIANAGYWIDEFHLDGLRLDATQQIFDSSEGACFGSDHPACPGRREWALHVSSRRERGAAIKIGAPAGRGRLRHRCVVER